MSPIWGKFSEVLSAEQIEKEVLPMLSLLRAATDDSNAQAFILQLYQAHERLMYSIVKKHLSDPYAREDIVQETILKLTQKVDLLHTLDESALSAYVAVATRNTLYSYLRKRSTEESLLLPWTPDLESLPQQEPTADERMILQEKTQYFFQVWKQLPSKDRFLLEGKYILQQSDQALAPALDCKPGSVRMKLTRLRRKVLKMIQDLEEGVEER